MNTLDAAYETIQNICYQQKLPPSNHITSALETLQEAYGHLYFQNSSGFFNAIDASFIQNKGEINRLFARIVRVETKLVTRLLDTRMQLEDRKSFFQKQLEIYSMR